MKIFTYLLIMITALLVLSFSVQTFPLSFQEEYSDIGTIKQSMLKPKQFLKTQKGGWVILKGQQISKESELFQLLSESSDLGILLEKDNKYFLPDARGVFIRSSNINGEGYDPKVNRPVGSLQNDTIQSHSHKFTLKGNNKRGSDCTTALYGCSGKGKTHNFETDPIGDIETRPTNISMYTYMKVSK